MLASRSDRHGTIADMDTFGVIVLTTDPEDCDGWTKQVVDRNKKCCGVKSGHLGHLFESQEVSERRIKELVNIAKLEVAKITLQEATAQATEIVYARWLDDAARGTPEDPAAVSSEDATQGNAPDHEDEVQETTPSTASRIIWSMEATTVIMKERQLSCVQEVSVTNQSKPGRTKLDLFGSSLSQRSESNRWRADGVRQVKFSRIHHIGNSRRDSKNDD